MDLGILILLARDLLMEYLDLAWPVLRWVAWGDIAATIAVNLTAAHGDLAGSVMHAAMPVLFIVVVEGPAACCGGGWCCGTSWPTAVA
jgi:hypothetical protein